MNQTVVALGQFFGCMTRGEWINFGTLLVLTLTLGYAASSYRCKARSLDYSSYLDLITRFSNACRRFWNIEKKEEKTENDKKEQRYEFGDFLNLIEAGCLLCRCGTIKGNPKEALEENLKEYIRATLFQY